MDKPVKSDKNLEQTIELFEKVVKLGRVTKVVKGGKNMSFRALVVVGDGKGKVGFGTGKAREVQEAARKAVEHAKRTMIKIHLKEGRTLHHDVRGKFGAGIVYLRTAPTGTGIIAGGPMRAVFAAAGLEDIVGKSVGTNNYYNMVRATFDALTQVTSPRQIAIKLDRKIPEIVARRDAILARKY